METRLELSLPLPPNTADNLGWVEECILRYDEQIRLLEAQRWLYVQMRDDMTGGVSPAPGRAGARHRPAPPAAPGGIQEDIDLTGMTVDLEGADDNHTMVLRVAEALPLGKLLNTTQVGRLLQRSGATGTKLQSLRVAVQRVCERNPQLFEPEPRYRATYRYTGGGRHNGADGGDDRPGAALDDPGDSN